MAVARLWAVPALGCLATLACGDLGGWRDVSYQPGAPVELATRTIRDTATGEGLTLVRTELEEGRRTWMLLDSGSSLMVLDRSVVEELGLATRARVGLGGCGIPASIRTGTRFRVGQMTVSDPIYCRSTSTRFFEKWKRRSRSKGSSASPSWSDRW